MSTGAARPYLDRRKGLIMNSRTAPGNGARWSAAIKTLLSFRMQWTGALAALICSLIVAFLLGLIGLDWLAERTVYFIGFPVWAIIMLIAMIESYEGANPMYCHSCGKRVKMNYTRCHHCGHEHKGE